MKIRTFFIIFSLFLFVILIQLSFISSESIQEEKCENVYFLVASTNYQYTDVQLMDINATREDIYFYSERCNDSNYPLLPERTIPNIIIDNNDFCNFNQRGILFVNFPIIELKNKSCKSIQNFGLFFGLEDGGDNYYIYSIRLWLLLLILSIIFLFFWKLSNLM